MEKLRVHIPILATNFPDEILMVKLLGRAQESADKISATKVTDLRYVERTSWDDKLGPRPSNLELDYLIYEGTGTRRS